MTMAVTQQHSRMVSTEQPPEIVYQAQRNADGALDIVTPLTLCVQLSSKAAAHLAAVKRVDGTLCSGVKATIRRFDLKELEVAAGPIGSQRMQRIEPCQHHWFTFVLNATGTHLIIRVSRKELPISTAFGGAAIVIVVHFVHAGETVVTSPFRVASKQSRSGVYRQRRDIDACYYSCKSSRHDEDAITAALASKKRNAAGCNPAAALASGSFVDTSSGKASASRGSRAQAAKIRHATGRLHTRTTLARDVRAAPIDIEGDGDPAPSIYDASEIASKHKKRQRV
jgi:hypothetical protein